MDDKPPNKISHLACGEEFWSTLREQLSEFYEVLFYTRPEKFEEAVGTKRPNKGYHSTAPRIEVAESTATTVHPGIIPFTTEEEAEFLDLAIPSARDLFYKTERQIEYRELTGDLIANWGRLSYYCGRIETHWLIKIESLAHHRGGRSNKNQNNIQAQQVWYSKMINVAKATLSNRKRIDRAIIDEIEFRRRQKSCGEDEFDDGWYGKFFNAEEELTASFTDKKLYGKIIEELAENPDNLPIPKVRFLSTPAIGGGVEGT